VFPNIDPSDVNAKVIYFDDGRALFAVPATPEGVLAVAPGNLAVDTTVGVLYVKASAASLNTGWVMLGSVAIGGAITGATQGSVLFAGPGGILAQDNTNLFWDDTNNDLDLGHDIILDASANARIRNTAGTSFFQLNGADVQLVTQSTDRLIGLSADQVVLQGATQGPNLVINRAGVFGSTGRGVIVQAVGVAPIANVADACQYFVKDSAAGDANLYVRNEAGVESRLSGCAKQTTADEAHNSGAFTAVTGLSFNLEASTRYGFEARILTTGTIGEGVRARMNGTATATHIRYEGYEKNANVDGGQARATAMAGVVAAATAVTAATVYIFGGIQVNAGGTFAVEMDTNVNVGDDALVFLRQSYMRIWEN
jgi:hypothetical protein